MTSVHFYTNVPDKTACLAELLQNIVSQHRKATVFVESASVASELSEALWGRAPALFLANTTAQTPQASLTPIVLDWQAATVFQDDVLVNLQSMQLTIFSRFKRLVEIVGVDEAEKAAARQRFSFYRDRGYAIKHIDMLKKSI